MKTNLSIANQSHQNRFADDTTSAVVASSINDSARSKDPAESRYYVLPAIAGIGYGFAWIVGLLVWPSNLAIDSTGRQVTGLYSHHVTQAAVQYILVEGVAGVLLGTVLIYLLRALQRQSPETKMLLPALLALSAAALSVLQFVLGFILIRSSRRRRHHRQRRSLCTRKSARWSQTALPLRERHMASEESQGGYSPLAAGGCVGHGRDAPSLRTLVSAAHERLRMDCVRGSPLLLIFMSGSGIWLARSRGKTW